MLKKLKNLLSKVGSVLSKVFYGATTPLTPNPRARSDRSVAGGMKDLFNKVTGRGKEPFKKEAENMRSSPSERQRGNTFNPSYASDGRLTIRLRDGAVDEGALQLLDALDSSDTGKLDPSSAALKKFPGLSEILDRKSARDGCDKLLDLRKRLESKGGSLSVERTNDGFGRELVVKIDTTNKTEEEVAQEIEDVLLTLGVRDKELAKNVARELLKRGSVELSNLDREDGISAINPRPQEVAEQPSQAHPERDDSVASEVARSDGAESSLDGNERVMMEEPGEGVSPEGAAVQSSSAQAEEELANESFSMSGASIPMSNIGSRSSVDQAAQQLQYLQSSRDATPEGEELLQQGGTSHTVDRQALLDAAEGLDCVQGDVSAAADSSLPEQPTATPSVQQAQRASESSRSR